MSNSRPLLIVAIVVAIVMQHFELFRLAQFPVTIGLVVGIPLVIYLVGLRHVPHLVVVLSALVGLTALAALSNSRDTNGLDYFGTLALLVVTAGTVILSTAGYREHLVKSVQLALFIALVIVVAFSALQVMTGYLGSEAFFNPWGARQYQYQYQPRLAFNPVPRAQGFFLEPSYDAFVIGSLAVCLLLLRSRAASVLVLAIAGMAAAQSATGMILFLVVLVLMAVKSRPAVGVVMIAVAVAFLVFFYSYLAGRIGSIGDIGSSGNYRLIAPLVILQDVLATYPLGLPLGSIYSVVPRYGLAMDGVKQTISLDNGIYVVVYYFGWVGLLALIALVVTMVVMLVKAPKRQPSMWLALAWFLGSLIFSGGIVAPEFGLMSSLVIAAGVTATRRSRDQNSFEPHIEHRHSYVQ